MTLASSDSSHISTQAQKTPLCLSQELTYNMAEENALESKPAQSIPERPRDAPADEAGAAPAEGEKGPSKSALKKAAKEKEKVRLALNHRQQHAADNRTGREGS